MQALWLEIGRKKLINELSLSIGVSVCTMCLLIILYPLVPDLWLKLLELHSEEHHFVTYHHTAQIDRTQCPVHSNVSYTFAGIRILWKAVKVQILVCGGDWGFVFVKSPQMLLKLWSQTTWRNHCFTCLCFPPIKKIQKITLKSCFCWWSWYWRICHRYKSTIAFLRLSQN